MINGGGICFFAVEGVEEDMASKRISTSSSSLPADSKLLCSDGNARSSAFSAKFTILGLSCRLRCCFDDARISAHVSASAPKISSRGSFAVLVTRVMDSPWQSSPLSGSVPSGDSERGPYPAAWGSESLSHSWSRETENVKLGAGLAVGSLPTNFKPSKAFLSLTVSEVPSLSFAVIWLIFARLAWFVLLLRNQGSNHPAFRLSMSNSTLARTGTN